MHCFHCCLAVLLFLTSVFGDSEENRPEVKIGDGQLRGVNLVSRKGKQFSGFRGIPYAEPPVGQLRFRNPVPVKPWKGVFEANDYSVVCPQEAGGQVYGREDCLIVNVYTPKVPNSKNKKLYPVMIFIHGGSLNSGSSSFYDPHYLIDHDIVVVTFNYRLGPLGFLSTEDEHSPGNYGLKDQRLVLQWVHKNIKNFGGNPKSVTIYGHSSGAGSVDYLMCAKGTKGLFHRAISQSGDVFNQWAQLYKDSAKRRAIEFGATVNCTSTNSQKLVDCLRTKDANELILNGNFMAVFAGAHPIVPFRVVVEPDLEGALITQTPLELFEKGLVQDVPRMIGYTSEEGALAIADLLVKNLLKELNDNRQKYFPLVFLYNEESRKTQRRITEVLSNKYFGNKPIDQSTVSELVKLCSDATIINGIEVYQVMHEKYLKSPLYKYYFNYRGSLSYTTMFNYGGDLGVAHFDDCLYLFPYSTTVFPNATFTATDEAMVDKYTALWTNFVKYGTPTVAGDTNLDFTWTPVSPTNRELLRIFSPTNISMGDNLIQDRVDFWLNLPYNSVLYPKVQEILCEKN